MSKFTRGPWLAEKHVVYALQDCVWLGLPSKENRFEAFVQGKAGEAELEANARLIASTPDLLAACQKLDELDWCIGYELGGEDNHKILDAALDMARAAIRKAIKGEAIG